MKVALAGSKGGPGEQRPERRPSFCAVASKALEAEWAAPSVRDGSPPAHLDLQEEVCPDAGRWASCAVCRQMAVTARESARGQQRAARPSRCASRDSVCPHCSGRCLSLPAQWGQVGTARVAEPHLGGVSRPRGLLPVHGSDHECRPLPAAGGTC